MQYTIQAPNKLVAGKDYSGLFITFEGPEGSGKSTQSEIIHDILEERLNKVAPWTKEPGGPESQLQLNLRSLYFFNKEERSHTADLFYMLTDRALHQKFLVEELTKKNIVISDRYMDSTRAYQGGGGELSLEMIDAFNAFATNGLIPDITILVDVSYETGCLRKKKHIPDHFESKERNYHEKLRAKYIELANAEPNRFILINGELSIETVTKDILEKIENHPAYQDYLKRI